VASQSASRESADAIRRPSQTCSKQPEHARKRTTRAPRCPPSPRKQLLHRTLKYVRLFAYSRLHIAILTFPVITLFDAFVIYSFIVVRPAVTRLFGIVADVASRDHGDPGDARSVPPPLTAIANAVRPSAAEEARTIAASTNMGTLATLTVDGGSVGVVRHLRTARRCAGTVCVQSRRTRPQPRRRPARQQSRSLRPQRDADPLAGGPHHTGRCRRATRKATNARPPAMRTLSAVAAAKYYIDYSDFSLWVPTGAAGTLGRRGYGRWIRRPGRRTALPNPTRSHRRPTGRSPISHADHGDAHRRDGASAGRIPGHHRGHLAPAPTGTDSICGSSPQRGIAYTRSATPHPSTRSTNCVRAAVELTRRAGQS